MRKLIGFISCLSLLLNGTIAASATRQSHSTQTRTSQTRTSRARTATQTNSPRTANTQSRRVVARSATKQTNSPRTTNTQSRRVVARAATRAGSTRTHVTPTRNVVARSAVRTIPSTTTAATYTNSYLADILDETTGLITTDAYNSCMKSYYACMDEICTARAPNQGRCGCADRTKSFADAQSAIATATTELIKVSGELTLLLTGDGNDISAAFQLTDAEKVLNCVSWRDASKNGTATAVEFGDWCAEHGIHNGKCSVRTAPSYCYQEFNNFGFDISDLNSGNSDIISALQGWAATKEAAVAIADSKTNNMAGVANGLANITNKPANEIKDSLAETWGYNLLEYAHNNVCARILDNCFNGIYEDCGFPPSHIRTCNNENGCPYNYNSRIALRPDTNEPIIIKPDPTSNPYHKSQCFGYTNTADPYINVRTAVADSRRSIIERYKIDANADCDTFGAALQRTAQNLEYQTQIAKQKLQEFRNDHTIIDKLLSDYYAYRGTNGNIFIQKINNRIVEYIPSTQHVKVYSCNKYTDAAILARQPENHNALECWIISRDDYLACEQTTGQHLPTSSNTCIVPDLNEFLKRLDTKDEFPQPDNTPLPTEPSELCAATLGKWNGTECQCMYAMSTWHPTKGCTTTRAGLEKYCKGLTMMGACIGSENYALHQCYSTSNSDSVPIETLSRICKWVGTLDSGYCTLAEPYCD